MEKVIILVFFALISTLIKSAAKTKPQIKDMSSSEKDNYTHKQLTADKPIQYASAGYCQKPTNNRSAKPEKQSHGDIRKNVTIEPKPQQIFKSEEGAYENYSSLPIDEIQIDSEEVLIDITQDIRRSIIAAEILGPPRALKKNIR